MLQGNSQTPNQKYNRVCVYIWVNGARETKNKRVKREENSHYYIARTKQQLTNTLYYLNKMKKRQKRMKMNEWKKETKMSWEKI